MKIHYHSDHLGSASFVTDREGAVCQHLQYLPFGELFVSQRNSEFDSRYKFTAKELDNETSYTYFGARYYDSDLSLWLSVDPMSDKYPSLSPYIYSANNPVVLKDPNGMDIVITGEDGEKTTYNQGMEYNGKDEFTNKTINNLNKMYSVKNGATVIDELVNSKNIYEITNESSTIDGADSFRPNENNGGGKLNMGNGMDLLNLSHELFHGYQYEKGQGGASIFNEVEAYLYSSSIDMQYRIDNNIISIPTHSFSMSKNNKTENGINYNNFINNLLYGSEFSKTDFDNSVRLFKSESQANLSGVYNNLPERKSNQTNYLLTRFYPLVKFK
jgi:RHS repeat-associated protein